ncbi:MAG TPA: hypothetical protein VH720_03005 [Candidatus Limnocylindrales bacterium]|jgi:hypothetical protein
MSKRHHAHRRKAYGRRQHELRERGARQAPDLERGGWDGPLADVFADPIAYLDGRGGRIRFAMGE